MFYLFFVILQEMYVLRKVFLSFCKKCMFYLMFFGYFARNVRFTSGFLIMSFSGHVLRPLPLQILYGAGLKSFSSQIL